MSIKCLKESILQGCASASGKIARKHHKDPHFYSTEQTKNMNETRGKGGERGRKRDPVYAFDQQQWFAETGRLAVVQILLAGGDRAACARRFRQDTRTCALSSATILIYFLVFTEIYKNSHPGPKLLVVELKVFLLPLLLLLLQESPPIHLSMDPFSIISFCMLLLESCVGASANSDPDGPAALVLGEHLSIGDDPSTMTVSWHTDIAVSGQPCVVWGPVSNTMSSSASSSTTRTATMTSCGATQTYLVSANRTAFVYHAVIGPLQPNRRYAYTVKHAGGSITGITYIFTAPQTTTANGAAGNGGGYGGGSGAHDKKSVIFFGDSGHSEQWSKLTVPSVAAEVASGAVSAIIHTGDMAYYSKDDDGLRGGVHAEELSNATGHVVPLMTVVGNGDVFCYRPVPPSTLPACDLGSQRNFRHCMLTCTLHFYDDGIAFIN